MADKKPITSRELIKSCGQDPDEPLGHIEFPSEMRMRPATDEEAQRGLNDTWPGDPVPAGMTPHTDLGELVRRLRQPVGRVTQVLRHGCYQDGLLINPDGPEAADAIQSLLLRVTDLELVADLALGRLGEQEPGDSRAMSDEFVAMAAIRCEQDRLDECREVVRKAIEALK